MTFDPGRPQTVAEVQAALRAMTAEGRAWLSALPLPVFFAPQGDRWSPAEHARHLAKSARPLVMAFRLPRVVPRLLFGAPHPSRTYEKLRADYHGKLAAGGQAGKFAPSREDVAGGNEARRAAILDEWTGASETVAAAFGSWSEDAADGACLPHPLLGPLTVREMGMFTVYHTVHHLSLAHTRSRQDT